MERNSWSYIDNLRWRQHEKEPRSTRRIIPHAIRRPSSGSTLEPKECETRNRLDQARRQRDTHLHNDDAYKALEEAEDIDRVNIATSLLDQRRPVPLYWERKNEKSTMRSTDGAAEQEPDSTICFDLISLLSFLKTRLVRPKNICDLGADEDLPRLLFYDQSTKKSPSAANVSNIILHTNFRKTLRTDIIVSLDLAIGFCENLKPNVDPTCGDGYIPCFAFLVRGDPRKLPSYIFNAFVDKLIIISSSDGNESNNLLSPFIKHSSNPICITLKHTEDCNSLWKGPDSRMAKHFAQESMKQDIFNLIDAWKGKERWRSFNNVILGYSNEVEIISISEGKRISSETYHSSALRKISLDSRFSNFPIPLNFRGRLKLQHSFKEEEKVKQEGTSLTESMKPVTEQQKPQILMEIQEQRSRMAISVLEEPILILFVDILQQTTRSSRLLGLQKFAARIKAWSEENENIKKANHEIKELEEEENRSDTSEKRKECITSVELPKLENCKYMNSIDISCLFRELGYLFTTLRSDRVKHLPDLAAQHLMDGGIIEFMDGDSAKINIVWITAVLMSLNRKLKQLRNGEEPRFSVRSVFGLQSCGKSTVLNTMFGCRLATSAGMCTRGINMFLVPCKRSGSPFHAIIGLDTEGLSSPEQKRSDVTETSMINNRMALFCVLLADAGLCISTTESNDLFRDTLGIVMAVYNAVGISSVSSRLFFLYNRSTSEDDVGGREMKVNQDRIFKEALLDAWKLASNQHEVSNDEEVEPPDFVNMLDKDRDIVRVKQLNMSGTAPNDIPEPSFGSKLAKFNDHIYQTITEASLRYSGTSIPVFIQRIHDLENAFNLGKFYLAFPDVMRYRQREKEEAEFERWVQVASTKSFTSFSRIKVSMVQYIGSENNAVDLSQDWNETLWYKDLEKAVTDSFGGTYETFEREMSLVIGDSSFEQKFPEYKEQWQKKVNLDFDGKNIELKRKWKVLLYIFTTVRTIQEKILVSLTQRATSLRVTLADADQAMDIRQLETNTKVIGVFNSIFEPELQKAMELDPNIFVFDSFKKILFGLSPPIPNIINIEEWDWAKQDGEESDGMREYEVNHGRYGIEGENSDVPDLRIQDISKRKEENEIIRYVIEVTNNSEDEFSEAIADKILKSVNNGIGHWNRSHPESQFSETDRINIIRRSVQECGQILQEKQNRYYKRSNLQSLIQKKREEMFHFFLIQITAKLGIEECCDLLRKELNACIRDSIFDFQVKFVRSRIGEHPWLVNEEASLALTDFKLLLLYKNGKKREAITSAARKSFYSTTISGEIEEIIEMDEVIESVIGEIKESIDVVVRNIEGSENQVDGTDHLEAAFSDLKNQAAERQLTLDVSTSLRLARSDIMSNNLRLANDTVEIISGMFKGVSRTLNSSDVQFEVNGKEIHKRLALESQTESNLQPRCGVPCPLCEMPCMKEQGHDERSTGSYRLHSCNHQPQGLSGMKRAGTTYLVWETCVDSKNLGQTFRHNGSSVSYKRFQSIYPNWEDIPATQRRRQVREFLFYNCQKELLKMFKGVRKCRDLDASNYYRHKLVDIASDAEYLAYGSNSRTEKW